MGGSAEAQYQGGGVSGGAVLGGGGSAEAQYLGGTVVVIGDSKLYRISNIN